MLKRKAYSELLNWKKQRKENQLKKCLLIKGARQVGKSYIVKEFGNNEYESFINIDFFRQKQLKQIFEGELSASEIYKRMTANIPGIKLIPGNTLIFLDEILYVDIFNHVLTFHTQSETISTRGTMKDVMESLNGGTFAMCNKSCVVNLFHVQMIDGDEVVLMNGERLSIGRPRKKEFMQQIADYYGNKKINLGRF